MRTDQNLRDVEKHFLSHQTKIESWFRQQWQGTPPPIMCSVDIRNAGFKLAPVDTNLFPAGFNNLNPDFLPLAIQAAQMMFGQYLPGCMRVLLIPESRAGNPYYFESVATLSQILRKSGYEIRIGSWVEGLTSAKEIGTPSGKSILIEPITRKENRLVIGDFDPCVIILNNDLSEGAPTLLNNLEQTVLPPLNMGWASRLKSDHFKHYQDITQELCSMLGLDPWLITPAFRTCHDVDFVTRENEDELVAAVSQTLEEIRARYQEFNIKEQPFVAVKAQSGTYGMGVLMVQHAEEIRSLNRKQRNRMTTLKGNKKLDKVIIQEGVHTFETAGEQQAVAEPVIYLLGKCVIGGFYRLHKQMGPTENLNSPGMEFEPLPFHQTCIDPQLDRSEDDLTNRFYTYGVIARLAALAAARETVDASKK